MLRLFMRLRSSPAAFVINSSAGGRGCGAVVARGFASSTPKLSSSNSPPTSGQPTSHTGDSCHHQQPSSDKDLLPQQLSDEALIAIIKERCLALSTQPSPPSSSSSEHSSNATTHNPSSPDTNNSDSRHFVDSLEGLLLKVKEAEAAQRQEKVNVQSSSSTSSSSAEAAPSLCSSTTTTQSSSSSPLNSTQPSPPLTYSQIWRLAIRTGLPFFGFGLCDNIIMITVGDAIDATFGVTLGFSTMVAAGLGQAVSDGAGISIQGAIENMSDKLGLPNPQLSPAQAAMGYTLGLAQLFRTLGIVAGCLVGVAIAYFVDDGNRPRLFESMFRTLPESIKKELMAKQVHRTFKQGDYMLRYGQEADGIFIIVTGQADVVGRDLQQKEMHIHTHKPGDTAGAIEMAFGHNCVADVIVCSSSLRAVYISKDDFFRIVVAGGGESSTAAAPSSSPSSTLSPEDQQRQRAKESEQSCQRLQRIREDVRRFVEEDDEYIAYRIRYLPKLPQREKNESEIMPFSGSFGSSVDF